MAVPRSQERRPETPQRFSYNVSGRGDPMTFDVVIRGGTIADGRGGALREADIAVSDGRIVVVGAVADGGREEIDAHGLLVAPGFVDIHSHYDGQVIWDDRLWSSGWHGVTTTVMGNCGVGFAPVRPADRELLVALMEGVEDIPGPVLRKGLSWEWSSFPEYLDAVERRPHDLDVCAQLPHSALRVFVMGERAARREAATPEDIAEMRALAAQAMRAGALGFSTSRSRNHRTASGEPIPSMGAEQAELTGIAKGLQDAGRGVLQAFSDLDVDAESRGSEFALLRRMVEESGRPLSISVFQRVRDAEAWRPIMALVEEAAKEGLPIRAQVIPRPLGTLFGLDMPKHPLCFHPSFKAIADLPLERKAAIMRDPAFRKRILAEHPVENDAGLVRRVQNFDFMFPFGDPPDYAPPRERSIAAIAKARGSNPTEVVYDYLLEDDGHSMLFAPNSGFGHHSLDGCREMMQNPLSVIGVSDGGAHVSHISDVSFSTFLLTYWGRDRPQGKLDLSWLVKRMTGDTAAIVGLHDRGIIAPGYKADINVIDLDRLRIERPYMAHDLPCGAKRLLQRARGYVATILSGIPVYREGEATGALPGRLVRGAQPSPRN
jgi:N-acyl-D-aspartate/D-glutamate deacylase